MRFSFLNNTCKAITLWVFCVFSSLHVWAQVQFHAGDYGVTPQNPNNTPALQAMVDSLHAIGGGIIQLSPGTYTFKGTVKWRSYVALQGVSVQSTVLRMEGNTNWSLFIGQSTAQGVFDPIESVRFEHFTVDAYAMNPKDYITNCKAFNIRPLTDAVFNDLVLKGTPATSLGVDFLNRVLIQNVRVIDGGRLWTPGKGGGSGIGIGLRGYGDENFIITNCICVGCGNNGIFVEDQARFGNGIKGRQPMVEGKGQIITGVTTAYLCRARATSPSPTTWSMPTREQASTAISTCRTPSSPKTSSSTMTTACYSPRPAT